jgi:hypothetical protein
MPARPLSRSEISELADRLWGLIDMVDNGEMSATSHVPSATERDQPARHTRTSSVRPGSPAGMLRRTQRF